MSEPLSVDEEAVLRRSGGAVGLDPRLRASVARAIDRVEDQKELTAISVQEHGDKALGGFDNLTRLIGDLRLLLLGRLERASDGDERIEELRRVSREVGAAHFVMREMTWQRIRAIPVCQHRAVFGLGTYKLFGREVRITEESDDKIRSSGTHCEIVFDHGVGVVGVVGGMSDYREFMVASVQMLEGIRDNPTPAKIDNVMLQLQALTLDQSNER